MDKDQIQSTEEELDVVGVQCQLHDASPIPGAERIHNLSLYTPREAVSRMLFFNEMYQKFLTVHGVIMEFGVKWGRDLAHMIALRGLFEPYNFLRTIIGFDTFEGLAGTGALDGDYVGAVEGNYAVGADYQVHLERALAAQEAQCPIPQIRKFELVKGDASKKLPEYLAAHPETVVAFAYFDMDIYEPTRACLAALRPYLTKGSILAFDEVGRRRWPGETIALRETLGFDFSSLQRVPYDPCISYMVVD